MIDDYTRRARLYPALLVAFPVSLPVAVLVPTPSWWGRLVAVAAASGLGVLPVQITRDLGARVQPKLWEMWGGPPSQTALRWQTAVNPVALAARHASVSTVTGIALPTAAQEAADPVAANYAYDAATSRLRELTRDPKQFGLLLEENINYGMRRNLYGCRALGLAVAALGAALSASAWAVAVKTNLSISGAAALGCLAVSLIWGAGWLRLSTPDSVRRAADRYADRLLGAADVLEAARR